MKKKKTFELPYLGIAQGEGMDFLYGERGDYSVIIQMSNPALRYCADESVYNGFHHLLLNIIKILGEGHLIQKQDILARTIYEPPVQEEYLQQSYNEHFKGRAYLQVHTYLILTKVVKKGAFYVYDAKGALDFSQRVIKVLDLLKQSMLSPSLLNQSQIQTHTRRILSMDFSRKHISLDNISPGDTHLSLGERAVKSITLVDIDAIDLPSSLSTFHSRHDGKAFRGFAMDNLSFLYDVPRADCIIYHQVLEIPSQSVTLSKLSLKRKRHFRSGSLPPRMPTTSLSYLGACFPVMGFRSGTTTCSWLPVRPRYA